MQDSTATVENNWSASYKININLRQNLEIPLQEKLKHRFTRHLNMNVHSSVIHNKQVIDNNQKVETTQMFISWWMDA